MTCDCISYNQPPCDCTAGRSEMVLPAPGHLREIISEHKAEHGICVDPCIADVIRALWDHRVLTLGCCCGHNKANPNVVIAQEEDAVRVVRLLATIDGEREWEVLQWERRTYRSAASRHTAERITPEQLDAMADVPSDFHDAEIREALRQATKDAMIVRALQHQDGAPVTGLITVRDAIAAEIEARREPHELAKLVADNIVAAAQALPTASRFIFFDELEMHFSDARDDVLSSTCEGGD